MVGMSTSDRLVGAVGAALERIGYGESLQELAVGLDVPASAHMLPREVPVMAFWDARHDQLTSAVAFARLPEGADIGALVRELASFSWAPFQLIATRQGIDVWDAIPEGEAGKSGPRLLGTTDEQRLAGFLASQGASMQPAVVKRRKQRARQMALYEAAGTETAFFEFAFQPTRQRLLKILRPLVESVSGEDVTTEGLINRLRFITRAIGVKIGWDKRWLQPLARDSHAALIAEATRYPTPWPEDALVEDAERESVAQDFLDSVSSVNFALADAGLLGQLIQTNSLVDQLRRTWKFYPTPPDVAWRMLRGLPTEVLAVADTVVWDGTCGTGTLLVAAMDRITGASGDDLGGVRDARVLIGGNEREPLLADVARISLDIAADSRRSESWNVTERDVQDFGVDDFKARRPTVIVGNPPFSAAGRRQDIASVVITKYLDLLAPGGLLSVVVPRSLLGATHYRDLRRRLISELQIYEVWELPQGFAAGASSEAAVLIGRKPLNGSKSSLPVVWRMESAQRRGPSLVGVVGRPDDWLESAEARFDSPLGIKLRRHLQSYPTLASLIGQNNIVEGITPGTEGAADVLTQRAAGAVQYLSGRTGLEPFRPPGTEQLSWLLVESERLWRPRRASWDLFRREKVLVTRRSTGGSPWPAIAIVDKNGLFPSDDYVAVGGLPHLDHDLIAGLLNSSLVACYIRLMNPARNVRVGAFREVPVPSDVSARARIATLAKQLRVLGTQQRANEPNAAAEITQLLDEAVADAFHVPSEIRLEVAEFFRWHGQRRPGHRGVGVAPPVIDARLVAQELSEVELDRLAELLSRAREARPNEDDMAELDRLLERWEMLRTAKALQQLAQR